MKILCAAHDPGGANLFLSIISKLAADGDIVSLAAAGPTVKIWQQFSPLCLAAQDKVATARLIDEIAPDVIVTGTSFPPGFEATIWREANERGIPCLAAIDAWVNGVKRFGDEATGYIWPDVIGVIDRLAQVEFTALSAPPRLIEIGQPFIEMQANNLRSIRGAKTPDSAPLWVYFPDFASAVDPVSGAIDPNNRQRFELTQVINRYLAEIQPLPQLIVKPHPRDNFTLWQDWLSANENCTSVLLSNEATESLLAKATLVLGAVSMVLIEAAAANIPVISIQLFGEGELNAPLMILLRDYVITEETDFAAKITAALCKKSKYAAALSVAMHNSANRFIAAIKATAQI